MKSIVLLIIAAAAIGPLAPPAMADEIEKIKVRSANKNRGAYAFVPEKLDAAAPVPLIVLLHGSGGDGMSQAEKWKALAKRERFVIVAPNSGSSSGWQIPADGPDFIRDVVEHMISKHPIDKRRVYIFGHSAGAVMALSLALLEPEYFAAASAHAGVLPASMASLADEAKRKIPVSLFVGTRDPLFPVEAVRGTQDLLVRNGFDVNLTQLAGHNHNYYAIANEVNEMVWTFLKEKKLAADPVYETHRFK